MKKIISILILLVLGSAAHAQTDSLFIVKVKKLQSLFDETNYKPLQFGDTSLAVIAEISKMQRKGNDVSRSLYLEKQLELAQKDYGVALTGGYLENINPTIGDLEDNIFYQRKFNLGAEWNLLKSGFFENKVKARILEDRILREQMGQDAAVESYNYLKRFDHTIYTFNLVKIQLLHARRAQLEKQYKTISELVYLKRLKKEDLITLDTRLSEVESLINVYKSYNDYLVPENDSLEFDVKNLPLIDLDYTKIFDLLGKQTDSLLSTRVYEDYYSWYHQISLKTYAKYSYYDLVEPGNRSFFSAGFNFNIPIPFNTRLKNEVANEKYKYDNEKLVQNRINLHEEILSTAYEFRYKLKQFIGFYQKRKLFMERLRVEKVKVRLNDNNIDPLLGLELYDDLLQIDIELVDLLQNLYLKALKVHSKIPHANIRDVIKYQTTDQINQYVDNKKRSVYVWSKTFEEYSPGFLSEYCIYNEFNKVIVSTALSNSSPEKLQFMQYAQENAEVHFMIGENKLFYSDNIGEYLSKVLEKYKEVKPAGIHIDIEPHTFAEWDTEKQKIISQYLELMGKISTFCKDHDLKLAVSIPLHYGQEVVDKLLALCDEIYFMCYENTKTSYIVNKVKPFIDNGKDKLILALRTEDFTNRIEMEEKIKELKTQTSLNAFAYHDLRRMVSFDRQNIEK
ncbi:MAG: hypothetical protein ABJG68_13835 [Crocinitomicaceae bacterium]